MTSYLQLGVVGVTWPIFIFWALSYIWNRWS